MGHQKIKSITVLVVSLTLTILFFQNCSDVGFSNAKRTQASVVERVEPEQEVSIEPIEAFSSEVLSPERREPEVIHEQADSGQSDDGEDDNDNDEPSSKIFNVSLKAYEPHDGPIEINLLLDDSKSNISNIRQILNGVRDLVDSLPNEEIHLKAYIINGTYSVLLRRVMYSTLPKVDPLASERSIEERSYSIKLPMTEFKTHEGGSRLEESLLEQKKTAFLETIQGHLNRQQAAVVPGSIPVILCEVVSLLSQNKRFANARSILLIATDEDGAGDGDCYKKQVSDRHNYPEPVVVAKYNVKRKSNLEGGGHYWRNHTQSLNVDRTFSCASDGKRELDYFLSRNSKVDLKDDSYDSCRREETTRNNFVQIAEPLHVNWLGEPNSTVNARKQSREIMNRNGQAQTFVGLFSLQEGDVRANEDQEPSRSFTSFIESFLPAERFFQQSILQSNFSEFVSRAVNFDLVAKNNRVDISQIYEGLSDDEDIVIQKVFIKKIGSDAVNQWASSFSLQGQSLVIEDASLNLSQGTNMEIEYIVIKK